MDSVIWDFSECSFLHPFYLAALGVLRNRYNDRVKIAGLWNSGLSAYFGTVYFDKPFEVTENHTFDVKGIYGNKTYVPLCKFNPKRQEASDAVQKLVQDTLKIQIGHHPKLHTILSLSLGEIVDNISDHANSDEGFIYSQYMKKEKMLYLFIADTGHSIYSSFVNDGRYADFLSALESSALKLALSGKSTKNRPENENRGYGISRTRKLIVEALGGSFFILSGGAFFRHEKLNEDTIVDLPDDIRWDGTVILLKIPTDIPSDLDIYDYIS